MTIQEKHTDKSMEVLNEAFEMFNQSTLQLKDAYDKLESQAEVLSNELDKKNRELNSKVTELEQTRSYLNNVLESITDGVVAVDLKGTITTCNKAALELCGYKTQQLLGKRLDALFVENTLFHMKSHDQIVVNFNRSGIETRIEDKEKNELPVILFSSPIQDEFGRVIGAVFTFKDLSLIKRLEDEIERSSRLASIGEMAAGVAHEIRNPLGGVEMYASILRREFINDPEKTRITENILTGVRSINSIVTEMLNFTKSFRKTSFQKVDLADVISSALVFAEVEFVQLHVEVEKRYDAQTAYLVSGDRDQLQQLFLNLFLNAAHAMKDAGGTIVITMDLIDGMIDISVADTGKGIQKEHIGKIFDPFFTTKSSGTGLGLAISHRIVEAHKGTIRVESRIQHGTTFNIRFPRINK